MQYKKTGSSSDNFKQYKSACDKKLVALGKMFITRYEDILERRN